jgi:hypothetical protein
MVCGDGVDPPGAARRTRPAVVRLTDQGTAGPPDSEGTGHVGGRVVHLTDHRAAEGTNRPSIDDVPDTPGVAWSVGRTRRGGAATDTLLPATWLRPLRRWAGWVEIGHVRPPARPGSGAVEGAREIPDQVVDMLDADRQPDEGRVDLERRARDRGVGHRGGDLDE